jgi:2-polyprenyl-6-methoxyphenol hydroxylase-like FAD-dependent oxidoreductase
LVGKRSSPDEDEATAHFEDGSEVSGSVVVGVDGGTSRARRFLRPDAYRNQQLDVRVLGRAVVLTSEEVQPLREGDPLL